MTTTQSDTTAEDTDSTTDQAGQYDRTKGLRSAVGAGVVGLGSALALAALAPAWLAYTVVGVVVVWLVVVGVPHIRKRMSA